MTYQQVIIYLNQISKDRGFNKGLRSAEYTLEKIKSALFSALKVKDPDNKSLNDIEQDKQLKTGMTRLKKLASKGDGGKSNFGTVEMSQEHIDEFINLGYPDLKQFMEERGIK